MKIRVSELLAMPPQATAAMIQRMWDMHHLDAKQAQYLYDHLIKAFAEDIRDGVVELTG